MKPMKKIGPEGLSVPATPEEIEAFLQGLPATKSQQQKYAIGKFLETGSVKGSVPAGKGPEYVRRTVAGVGIDWFGYRQAFQSRN